MLPGVSTTSPSFIVKQTATPRPSRSTSAPWPSTRRRSRPTIPTWPSASTTSLFFYAKTNRSAEAEPLYERALAINEAAFAPDHPNVALSLNNLAFLYAKTNRSAEAEPLYERALDIFTTSFGPDHPNTRTTANNLARLRGE
jgi:tetratricopeptide (TPR) repeat protein